MRYGRQEEEEWGSPSAMTKNIASSVSGYLPNTLTEMWGPWRDFAFLKLPTSGALCIVALSGCVSPAYSFRSVWDAKRTIPQIMVVSSERYFYSYSIDLENGASTRARSTPRASSAKSLDTTGLTQATYYPVSPELSATKRESPQSPRHRYPPTNDGGNASPNGWDVHRSKRLGLRSCSRVQ